VPTRLGENRTEDVLLAAEASSTAVRHIGGDRVQCLGSRHQTSAGAIKSTIHVTVVKPLRFLSANIVVASQ
jgi:hypothetical protein